MSIQNTPQIRFLLKGFSQDRGFRRFAFEGIGDDHARLPFTVHADLNLLRLYGIAVQELPLICQKLLEQRGNLETGRQLVFTEEEMRQHRDDRLAAQATAVQRRKSPRRPQAESTGMAWRATAPLIRRNPV